MATKPNSRATGNDSIGYLRVSSASQVKTDYDPEGISIPAQRLAVKNRAKELKSPYVQEFVEPGKSAKSIEHRPEFQDMITYLRANPNVKYVIVYALSRFARNRYDDAIMMVTLDKLGVTLISATEKNLDDTPTGKAMHGMIAVFNQYQSDASGEDIKYKMGQKVIAAGGMLGRARVGYRNIRDTSEGREIRTIAVDNDKDRAALVREAFELYATGEYTIDSLLSVMADKRLTIRATPKHPEHPISRSALAYMLRDRRYIGEVPYKGQWYPGRHEPLVSRELFEAVQRVLDTHQGAGVRQRKHNHYLKGIFFCARCGNRYILQRAKGNGGIYYYFYCHGTKRAGCTQPYVPLEDLEHELERHYTTVRLTDDFRAEVAAKVEETLRDEQTTNSLLEKRLTKRLAELDAQEDRYLDLLGDPDWPQDKLKAKMAAVRAERTTLGRQLAQVGQNLDVGRQVLAAALELLGDPQALFRQSDYAGRRLLTLTVFDKLLVDVKKITDHELREPFSGLVSVHQRRARKTAASRAFRCPGGEASGAWGDLGQLRAYTRDSGALPKEDAALDTYTTADLLTVALEQTQEANGSHKPALVELRGLEPLTPTLPAGFA